MTKTTREIEKRIDRLDSYVIGFITVSVVLFILFFFAFFVLNERVSQLPHKYCYNETIINPEYEKYLSKSEYDILFNLTLSERMELTCNKQCLYEQLDSAIGSFYSSYTICFAICVQKSFYLSKEVCEIR